VSDNCLPPGDRADAPEPLPEENALERVQRMCREKGWDLIHWRRGSDTACGRGLVSREDPHQATCPDCRRLAVLPPLEDPARDPGQEG
jgi:hypothetical protein